MPPPGCRKALSTSPHTVRPQPDRLPAHRRGADRPVQLAAGPPSRRPVHPPDRRHRPAAACRGGRRHDPRRLPLDRASTGTKGPRSAGRSALITSRSGPRPYRRAAERLLASGHAYRDYSTDSERAAEKAAAEREKRAYRFRRKPLTDAEAAQFEAEGRPFALRFQVPPGRTLVLHDLIKGDVEFSRPTRSATS